MSSRITVVIDPDLKDLIPGFLANRQRDLVALRRMVGSGDFVAARIIGHSMKGAGGGYGFTPITEFGDAIEIAALAGDGVSILATTELLADYLSRIDLVFE